MTLRDRLRTVPDPPAFENRDADAIADTTRYLESDDALRSIAGDTYWPKWSSPWWHMLLLFEIGEARRIPERVVTAMIAGLDALPLHIFPIHPEDKPPGTDVYVAASCHCAVGSMYRVLSACGVDVARALPWFETWFPRYQMSDGGLTCDNDAYLVTDECPSSMVGTIAPFEAMTSGAPARWSPERAAFVDRAARFLTGRELRLGSSTRHNAEERVAAEMWPQLCFPRFYFYDNLRGLAAVTAWATAVSRPIPLAAVSAVVDALVAAYPDGVVHLGRQGYAGCATRERDASGAWVRRSAAYTFPLLERVSEIGRACPYLMAQWTATRHALAELDAAGLVVS